MTARTGTKCPKCPKIVHGGDSQWAAHARTHTYLKAGARRWITTTPWWQWSYELLVPDAAAPRLWLERTPANWPAGVKATYVAHREVAGREQVLTLAATNLAAARKEAVGMFQVADWAPMLSLAAAGAVQGV